MLIIASSTALNASILDEIEKLSPNFFNKLFDHDLYDMSVVNDYDEGKDGRGESFGERLQRRKENKVKQHFFTKIEAYKTELSKLDPQAIIPGLMKSAVNGITSGAVLHYGLQKGIAQAAVGGGGAFVSSAAQIGIDILYNQRVMDELKKAEILSLRLMAEIKSESIRELEEKYLDERDRLSTQERLSIEKVLLAERNINNIDKHPDPKSFVMGIINLPQHALIVPSNFVKTGDYGETQVDDQFVNARDQFLSDLFPSLNTPTGVPTPSTDRELDSDFYPRVLRERFKEIIGKISDYSYFSLSNQENAVERRGIIFQGKPGAGKSQAAILFAEKCGLPYFHMSIQGKLDLKAIWGEARGLYRDGEIGAIAQAFLKKNKDGKTAKNAILILDDIDRAQAKDVLAFLMEILDITKTPSFLSRYFDFEISLLDIIIILTINSDWQNDPVYSALLSRADFIVFPDAPTLQLKDMLKKELQDRDFRLSAPFRGNQANWGNIRTLIADFVIDQHDVNDNRQRISRAKTLLRYPQADWATVAQNQGW